nr:MAG: maturation protein [Sanya fiers-like virus 19]
MESNMGGPFTKTFGSPPGREYDYKRWYTQGRPYKAALEYQHTKAFVTRLDPGVLLGAIDTVIGPYARTADGVVRARVAQKLYGKLSDPALWATNLLEMRQSISMIARRFTQLTQAFRAVKAGKFGKAAKVLGISVPKGVSRKKQVANNWLEFHFGWAPMYGDIYHSVEILQGPPPPRKVVASGSNEERFSTNFGGFPNITYSYVDENVRTFRCKTGCYVQLTNSDLYLANQLGLTNPLGTAWEAVPWSFVIDWVLPVGAFLSAMTATYGLSVSGGYTTSASLNLKTQRTRFPNPGDIRVAMGVGMRSERVPGITPPSAILRPRFALSPTRALTAWALFIQTVRSK